MEAELVNCMSKVALSPQPFVLLVVQSVNDMVHGVLSDYSFLDYAKPIHLHSILDDLWDDFSNGDTDTDTDDADENKEV